MAESFLAGREHSAWQAVQGMDVPHLLEARAEQAPDHPFIVWCPSRDSSTTYSYSEIFEQARRLAMGLSGNGVGVGDFVLRTWIIHPSFSSLVCLRFSWCCCCPQIHARWNATFVLRRSDRANLRAYPAAIRGITEAILSADSDSRRDSFDAGGR